MDTDILDVDGLAAALGVSRASVYRWRAAGRDLPPAIRIGSSLRWRASTVNRWLTDHELANA